MGPYGVHAVNLILCALCLGLGGGAYAGLLPARMGVLPIIALVSVAGHYGGAWWMQRSPSALNMPDQAAYDALSEADQQRVIAVTLPFFHGSVTLWTGVGMVSVLVPETPVLVVVLVLANVVEGAMAVRFLLLKAPRKVRELRERDQEG